MCNPAQTAQAKHRLPASGHFENLFWFVGGVGAKEGGSRTRVDDGMGGAV